MAMQGSGSAVAIMFWVVVFSLLCCCSVTAKNVDIDWNQGTDYSSFSQTNSIGSGDTVTFKFSGSHTATVVSESDYNGCTASSIVQSLQSGSPLTVTKDTYVICTVPGHCSGGMKVALKPSSTSTTPTTPSTPATPSTPTTPTTPETPTTTTPAGSGSNSGSRLQAAGIVVAAAALAPLLL